MCQSPPAVLFWVLLVCGDTSLDTQRPGGLLPTLAASVQHLSKALAVVEVVLDMLLMFVTHVPCVTLLYHCAMHAVRGSRMWLCVLRTPCMPLIRQACSIRLDSQSHIC